jgi:hypothetical protein
MRVTQRAVARGFARSASMARRARTSAATDSARLSNTLATPAPRRRAARIRFAATRSPVASSRSSANIRSACSVDQRAFSRATSRVTSGRIGSGADRSVATSASSNPTPTVSTPDSERVHSSIASSRSICAVAGGAESRMGRPANAAGTTSTATSQPLSKPSSTPTTSPTMISSWVRRSTQRSLPPTVSRDRCGAGGRCGMWRSPATMPIRPATSSAPASAGMSGVMTPPGWIRRRSRTGRSRAAPGPGTHRAAPPRRRSGQHLTGTHGWLHTPSPARPG